MQRWGGGRSNVQVVDLSENVGKAEALNRVIQVTSSAELIAVYDADLRPEADSLRLMVAPFAKANVGAVSGYRCPMNGHRHVVARYAALEAWVHQLVILAGIDRLGLNPPTMGGNCVYRRRALADLGQFPQGSLGEDIEVSLALIGKGWRTRFLQTAVAHSRVGTTLTECWHQRARWTYGMYHSARWASGPETLLVVAGYADRLVLLVSVVAAGLLNWLWPGLYLLAASSSVLTGLIRARVRWAMPKYLLSLAVMLLVDVAWTAAATSRVIFNRPLGWFGGQDRSTAQER